MIKSKKLTKGDTIAIVSPSWGGPSTFPHIYNKGIENLKKLGFKIKEFPFAKKDADYTYNNPKFRAKDINDAFKDPEVKGIITSIGGDDSIRILPYIDAKLIKKNPKIIMGYSDTTTLLTYINQIGLVTLHGPSIMAGFSQMDSFEDTFKKQITDIFFNNPSTYEYKSFESYCNGYPNWCIKSNTGKTKKMNKNKGWDWIQGDSVVQGELFGGNIEVFEFMKSTKFWPKEDFWKNKILFFETSEEKPTPDQVKYMLRNYGMQGIFNKISALIIGRPMRYSNKEKKELKENVIQIIRTEFNNKKLPIIMNMDFGHTDPQWILPLGIKAQIDCKNKSFRLIEKIFED